MRIGLIGRHGRDYFLDNLGAALRRLGHRVTPLGVPGVDRGDRRVMRATGRALRSVPRWQDRLHHQSLARAAVARECDAVLTTNGDLAPAAVAYLRSHRVSTALWFPDAVCNLGRQRMLHAGYTALFFKDPLLVDRLRDTLGLPVWYLPQGCNPTWHRPIGAPGTARTVVVAGNIYPSRAVLLRRLHDAGVPLTLYGPAMPAAARRLLPRQLHAGYPVFREEKSRVFRTAAAVLNNLHPAELHGINARLFEATAAGAAVLCEDRPVLGSLYDRDAEVVAYRTAPELLDRARELLADPTLTAKIGDAATARAHREHTYDHRLPTVLEKLA